MDFVHRSYEKGRTIAQIATPAGEGGISIIRISGDDALTVGQKIFSKDLKSLASHSACLGKVLDEHGNTLDLALVLKMENPRSFTGEDTVEIHCHGGSLITQKILKAVFAAGALPALPGEFSFKAFMNGKMDLTQAEAIQEMISAKSDKALKAAQEQLEGRLKEKIVYFQQELAHITAILEAWVDYPEEGLEFASYEEILGSLENLNSQMQVLCSTYHEGQLLKSGIKLSLLGAPNAGKSSLLNALLGKNRAIVTEIAGTTRDTLDVDISFDGLHFILTDTAGIRETDEIIEQEGIKRSIQAADIADLVLLVLDASLSSRQDDDLFSSLDPKKTLVVLNKADLLPSDRAPSSGILVSAKNLTGIDTLKQAIKQKLFSTEHLTSDQIILTKERHHQALVQAQKYLGLAIQGLQTGLSPELLSMDMRACLHELGTIIGTNITEDILNAIFSKFCVGK
jgi:tRNA modification GTPase